MSDEKTEEKSEYTPPPVSWRLPVFIYAPIEEIKAKQVSCSSCPVFIQCDAGEGGTGWVCGQCKMTGVEVTPIEEGNLPDHLLMIDCAKHKFNRLPKADNMTICSLCSGGQMELEIQFPNSHQHYIATEYMTVPVEERQRFLREKYEFWKAEYEKEPKE